MRKLFVVLCVLVASVAQAQQVEYPSVVTMTVMEAPQVSVELGSPPKYFYGSYLGVIEDDTEVLTGGWPIWMLSREPNEHTQLGQAYTTYISRDPFVSPEEASQIEYLINQKFVGQRATCQDINSDMVMEWTLVVTTDHVQEAIWSIYERTPIEDLPCPVDQLITLANMYAKDWERCGPRYRLHLLIPTTAWGGAVYPNLFVFTLYDDVPCEESNVVAPRRVGVKLEAKEIEAKVMEVR